MPVTVITSLAQFNELIKGDKLVIVDYFAVWCGPCKVISPKFAALSDQYTNAVFVKVDVDEVPDVAQAAGISAMPTFHAYKNGERLGEVVGANPAALESLITANNA
ncbi:thioredoxin trx1 [Blastocladiella emersonii ATCC 22665]|nr:thioredoxin trx1 [Blastocladiella emersonii ATCC 22665]